MKGSDHYVWKACLVASFFLITEILECNQVPLNLTHPILLKNFIRKGTEIT